MRNKYITGLTILFFLGVVLYAFWKTREANQTNFEPKLEKPSVAVTNRNASGVPLVSNTSATPGDLSAGKTARNVPEPQSWESMHPKQSGLTREEIQEKMRKDLKWQMNEKRKELNEKYGSLFKRLGLSGDEMALLKDLLVDYELAPRIVGVGLTDSEEYAKSGLVSAAEAASRRKAYEDQVKANMRELLGDDDYAYTLYYINTRAERIEVNGINDFLKGTTEAITNEQAEALVGILYRGRGSLSAKNYAPLDYLSVYKFKKQYAIENASGILTQKQLSALKSYYDKEIQKHASGVGLMY